MIKAIYDVLYPRRCPICGEIVSPRGELVCPPCKLKLNPVEEPRCKKCSKPIISEEKEYCHDCETKNHHYVKGYALWVYDASMKKSISDFKYHGRREYSDFYIDEIIKRYGKEIESIAPDVLIPIPVHKSKQIMRGYNQADILARGIGSKLNITVLSHLLQRDKKTLPQKLLNDKERLKNLEKAFTYSEKEGDLFAVPIHKVMLIDDIYTTGSTIEACTNILTKNGIDEVYFLSVCIGKGF
ncbi:ComF family protein [Anaerocolumna sp. AGMB13025]|uniref:ComF family protein n=1 Tax=Anaerocolumna sp. AGMB13025 TaxID=3039116 RepID=UPI00241BEDBD|nr:ComF family protein [Anaerocolumna sp. AGMB13025]WFR57817.1 ComF family protein [Anaerocolumna sp. AGMB13025]